MSANKPRFHTLLRHALPGAFLAAGGLLLLPASGARADSPIANSPAPALKSAPGAAQLTYDFKPGETHRYRVTAIFVGHIPMLSQPGGPPNGIELKMVYAATTKKVDDKGAVVEFSVEQADVNMLDPVPGDDGKIAANSETPFPVPLDQVQGLFNVTATLKPDGTVAEISGGSNAPIKLDLGIDPRKLFLTTMPVIFSTNMVNVNDTWPATDGLLGNKEGKVTYTNRLLEITPKDKGEVFTINEDAQNVVDAKVDKDGKSTTNAADAAVTTSGKITITGKIKFMAQPSADKPDHYIGRVSESAMTLVVNTTRKILKADPNNPDDPKESVNDIKGHFTIVADDTIKPAGASIQTPQRSATRDNGIRKVAAK